MTADQTVWEQVDSLDERTLAMLAEAALEVLAETGGEEILEERSPSAAAAELQRELASNGVSIDTAEAAQLVQGEQGLLTAEVLKALGGEPLLARQIEDAFAARQRMMVVDPLSLSAIALVLGVLKLKRVKVGKTEVEFYEARSAAVQAIRGLLNS